MAQITHSTRTTPRPWKSLRNFTRIEYFQTSTCESSAKIVYGDVVQFDVNVSTASGRIVKASTMANVPNVISTALVGIAAEADGSTVSSAAPGPLNQRIGVYLGERDNEFLWPSKTAGADYLSTMIGTRRAIGYDSTLSMFYLDTGNSTAGNATLIVTGLANDEGTTNGAIIAKFISTNVARLVSGAL